MKEKQKIINPASGEIITEIALASEPDVKEVTALAREAFDKGPWPRLPLAERKNFLLKISQGIRDKAGELAKLETQNTGKPIKETTFMDIPSSAKTFEFIANNFQKYLEIESPNLEAQAQCRLIREPIGVVVLIVPWNYPLLIASWKLASALASGNTVILKPSSLTPLTAIELGKIIAEAGIPKGVVNVICADAQKIGRILCEDSRVDMISFTGSNTTGRKILEYSLKNTKKMLLELGGKSASIIFKDADLETVINSCLCSAFLNQGQMCTAMSRILVEDEIYDKFSACFIEKAKRIKLGMGEDFQTQMGPLISEEQRKNILDCVEKAKKQGAKLCCGGKIPLDPNLKNGFFFEPTVFIDVLPQMAIFQEEAFGPIACISKFSSLNEAVSLANDSNFGLAGCIWTKDITKAEGLAKELNTGTIWINTYGMFYNECPFGGFKQSGFGKELGKEGFLEYTRLKNVLTDLSPEGKPLVNYWYGF
ncbi:MAG: aldehyde dehydrogenase family protein [Candidatus Omnitrophota bacterium]|nr:aldehyde dehydrogenase family protein [Candidatus Omnitrophota bacterium]